MSVQERNIVFPRASLFGWSLFDFANSVPAVIGGIYFANWFTVDMNSGSLWLNALFFVSSLFILIVGKLIGRRIDIDGYKMWIVISSLFTFFGILFLFLGSQFLPPQFIIPVSFILFFIFLFGYQIGRICHNVYLRNVIPLSIQNKMSGIGTAANWAGSIVGILITIPIISKYPGMLGRELTFLAATIAYGILTTVALFLMFLFKDGRLPHIQLESTKKLPWVILFRRMGIYLLIYLFLFDVMATVQRNLPPYLSVVFQMSDRLQSFGFLLILLSAMGGGFIAAKILNYKNTIFWLRICSASLMISIIFITLNPFLTWIAFILAGISYGMLESAIRINFMNTFAPEHAGENFGVLAVVERMSGVIGPLLWIIPFSINPNESQAYVFSMILMALLTALALVLLFFNNKTQRESHTSKSPW